jgi:hypothetical protein
VLPNTFSSRIAISGETPVWPFSRSDSALRVTPRASAAAVTVRPSGFEAFLPNDFARMGGVVHIHLLSLLSGGQW